MERIASLANETKARERQSVNIGLKKLTTAAHTQPLVTKSVS